MEKRQLLEKAIKRQIEGFVIKGVTIYKVNKIDDVFVLNENDKEIDESLWELGKRGSCRIQFRGLKEVMSGLTEEDNYNLETVIFQIDNYDGEFSVKIMQCLMLSKE